MNKQNPRYLPVIDGMRALAVTAVIIYHLDLLPRLGGGFSGVDVFFVISGYIISRSLHQSIQSSPERLSFPSYLAGFYERRIRRILPALLVCLSVTFAVSTLFIPPVWLNQSIDRTGLHAFFGVSNIHLAREGQNYFSPRGDLNPFLHTWSLGVEEQFYLIYPLLFYFWLAGSGSVRRPVRFLSHIILPVLTVLSLAAAFLGRDGGQGGFYLLNGRFWEMAAGALLFMGQARGKFLPRTDRASALLLWGGLALALASFILSAQGHFPFPGALLPAAGSLMMLSASAAEPERPSLLFRLLRTPPFLYLGKRSYSLYLWHWPVIVLMRWTSGVHTLPLKITALFISFALASLSYRFVESPFRRGTGKGSRSGRILFPSAILALLVLWSGSQFMVRHKEELSLSVTRDSFQWRSYKFKSERAPEPLFADENVNGRRLFVWGDSHAAAYRTMVNIVSSQLGVEAYEFERGGCAVAGLLEPMADRQEWAEYYENTLEDLRALARSGDVVFLASLRMPELADRFEPVDLVGVKSAFFSFEANTAREAALAEADRIITELESLGVTVLIDAPKPVVRAPLFRCSDWFNRNNPVASEGVTMERALLEELRGPQMASLAVLQERHDKLAVWDPFPLLCPGEIFSPYDGEGLPLYFDGDHLSGNGNRHLVSSFKEELLSLWRE